MGNVKDACQDALFAFAPRTRDVRATRSGPLRLAQGRLSAPKAAPRDDRRGPIIDAIISGGTTQSPGRRPGELFAAEEADTGGEVASLKSAVS